LFLDPEINCLLKNRRQLFSLTWSSRFRFVAPPFFKFSNSKNSVILFFFQTKLKPLNQCTICVTTTMASFFSLSSVVALWSNGEATRQNVKPKKRINISF
jgi:hypothetical protein